MILVFASSKGGVGKSTTCAALGAALAQEGSRVLLLDLDQNRTLHRWSCRFSIPGLTIEAPAQDDFVAVLRTRLSSGDFDHILIDLPGVREGTMLKAISRADLVIIPAQASEPDLREAFVISRDVRDVQETAKREIPYRLLLTKMHPLKNRVSSFIYADLARNKMPIFKTVLVERTAYREMFLNGESPTQQDPGKGAGLEIAALLDEIEEVVYPDAAAAMPDHIQAAG